MKTLIALFIGMLFTSNAAFAQQSLQDVNYDDNGRFAVQVEAWQSEVKAEQRVTFWKNEGLEHASFSEDGDTITGAVWYRVFLGRFATIDDARAFQEAFAGMYEDQTWITTTEGAGGPITSTD